MKQLDQSAPMIHPQLDAKDVPVFDTTKAGLRVRAERFDEPGRENLTTQKATESPKNGGVLQALLSIDIHGDWSWKPNRDVLRGEGKFVKFAGVPPSATEAAINAGIHKGHGWRGL
jgi:hypothetical protein